MSVCAILTLIGALGAFCLALLALARRWLGEWPWLNSGRGAASKEPEETRHVQIYIMRMMAQRLLLALLRERFGELPAAVVSRIEQADPAWCEELYARALTAASLEELGLLDEPDAASSVSHAGRT